MEQQRLEAIARLVVEGRDLPDYVFAQRFASHFFFDAALGDPDLTRAIQKLVTPYLSPKAGIAMYAAYSRTLLGVLDGDGDWAPVVESTVTKMLNEGDCGGMFWIDTAGCVAVYQRQPVDMGVLALNAALSDRVKPSSEGDAYFATEYFFGTTALALQLADPDERAQSATSWEGRSYLQALIDQYG